jgi:hypothetical protein
LMYLLGKYDDINEVKNLFVKNLRGERSEEWIVNSEKQIKCSMFNAILNHQLKKS